MIPCYNNNLCRFKYTYNDDDNDDNDDDDDVDNYYYDDDDDVVDDDDDDDNDNNDDDDDDDYRLSSYPCPLVMTLVSPVTLGSFLFFAKRRLESRRGIGLL